MYHSHYDRVALCGVWVIPTVFVIPIVFPSHTLIMGGFTLTTPFVLPVFYWKIFCRLDLDSVLLFVRMCMILGCIPLMSRVA